MFLFCNCERPNVDIVQCFTLVISMNENYHWNTEMKIIDVFLSKIDINMSLWLI